MNSRIFRIATIFEKPHPIFLDFPESELYLISLFHNICLDFSDEATLLKSHKLCSVVLNIVHTLLSMIK